MTTRSIQNRFPSASPKGHRPRERQHGEGEAVFCCAQEVNREI